MFRTDKIRSFSRVGDAVAVPDLIEIQLVSYERFLQQHVDPAKRKREGLEGLLREIFPIQSYDEKTSMEYLDYDFAEPRYTVQECRDLKLTYGMPFRIRCRLTRKEAKEVVEESIFLGEVPIMIGGGEFIINGAERVIVSQLHRSPGVDFTVAKEESDRPLHAARVIPERGSWIELGVTKKDSLSIRIDQSGKIPATTFLRAMDEKYGSNASILREFYQTKTIPIDELRSHMYLVQPFVDPDSGEELVRSGGQVGESLTAIVSAPPTTASSPFRGKQFAKELEDAGRGQELRKDYADNILTEFKYVEVKGASKEGLEAIEFLLATENVDSEPRAWKEKKGRQAGLPRFNQWHDNWKSHEDSKAQVKKEGLEEVLMECRSKICSKSGWFKFDDETIGPKGSRTGSKKEELQCAGVYFIRNTDEKKSKTNGVGEGYIGISGFGQKDKLYDRLRQHRHETEKGDESFLTTLLLDWNYRYRKGDRPAGRDSKARAGQIEVIEKPGDALMLNTVAEDPADSHDNALLRIYVRLRPGNPPQVAKAKTLFAEKFYDENRYRLGKVGRFRVNRKFKQDVPESAMTLRVEDFVNTLKYIVKLRGGEGVVDDIDHLGNRRLRTICELACEELRKGLLKLRRTVQERMSLRDQSEPVKIAELINSKSISSSIDYFFGRSELSQVVDQQNPLSQLTHERRLSALGPGGLNRKRAGFEVRDVHISHYGRICPIETPEGNNIGLISSLGIYATVDEYGFLTTPYRVARNCRVVDEIVYLRADEEMEAVLAPPDALEPAARGDSRRLPAEHVLARVNGELGMVDGKDVHYVDISPKQTVGVSAALIPFLEHDDANRALMGSNMQRQAVPLIRTEPPIVATGMERAVAQNSSMVVRARKGGTVTYVDCLRIIIDNTDEYELEKFRKLNERSCQNQKPIVREGQRVKAGQVIADGSSIAQGELALGRNVLVAFMPFDGYNFEDAILISERLVKVDAFTSVHLEEYEVEIRETKLGREEFTRDIPNVSEKALANLDEDGIVCVGTRVRGGQGHDSILVGKVSPKSKSELSPEEKLLHAIFGRAGEEVKNDSLELPAGEEGVVVDTRRFSRRSHMSEDQKRKLKKERDSYKSQMNERMVAVFRELTDELAEVLGAPLIDPSTRQKVGQSDVTEVILEQIENFSPKWIKSTKPAVKEQATKIYERYWPRITEAQQEAERKLGHMKRGDELPSGVLEMVKVIVATKRTLAVGDKMAGRHGNKGVIAKILPEEDMPFLSDGTSVDLVLNPLGVPGRMNLGQILETHLGWAAAVLGFQAVTPVFDGAREKEIFEAIREANEQVRQRRDILDVVQRAGDSRELLVEMPEGGKVTLHDGRTGEPFEQKVTVGFIYMNKLHHLVDEKIHARATGPYSLITQQPLGGKARTGGQRFGEMEVWGLEAYGASYTLQELLTVKSDDVEGRTKIYESMVKGTNTLEAGTPVSFDVLCNELRGLGLNVHLEKKRLI